MFKDGWMPVGVTVTADGKTVESVDDAQDAMRARVHLGHAQLVIARAQVQRSADHGASGRSRARGLALAQLSLWKLYRDARRDRSERRGRGGSRWRWCRSSTPPPIPERRRGGDEERGRDARRTRRAHSCHPRPSMNTMCVHTCVGACCAFHSGSVLPMVAPEDTTADALPQKRYRND